MCESRPHAPACRRARRTHPLCSSAAALLLQLECPLPTVLHAIRDAAAASGVEMLFSASKIAGELERVFFIRTGIVDDLITIARQMNARGWVMKIEDGYRSLEMQRQLVRKPAVFDAIVQKCLWENGGQLPPIETIFRRATCLVANIPKIGTHMSGSAVDISVFRRDDGSEVWRGNEYLHMSERAPMRSPFVEPDALHNRMAITAMMELHGFVHYTYEFWHYNKGDALGAIQSHQRAPARYGAVHWDRAANKVTAVDDPCALLNPLDVIEKEVAAAMERAGVRAGTV